MPFSPARLHLLSHAIELAAKSLHVAKGRAAKDLRNIGHDLLAACSPAILADFKLQMTAAEVDSCARQTSTTRQGLRLLLVAVARVRQARRAPIGPQLALSGWPGLPNEPVLAGLLEKLLTPDLRDVPPST